MTNNQPPMPSPDLVPQDGQDTPPVQDMPPTQDILPAQGTLPPEGLQPKLHEGTPSPQQERNAVEVPDYAEVNAPGSRAEKAREALRDALEAGQFKPDAAGFTRRPLYQAAVGNEHKPVGTGEGAAHGKNGEMQEDIDAWINTNGRLVMIGGYGESQEVLEAAAKTLAERQGIDPSRIDLITMAEGLQNPERVRELVHSATVVKTHSAGATVIQEAFKDQDAKKWLRPGLIHFHNPPSAHRRPVGKESSDSKKLNLFQLLKGALVVGDDDRLSHSIGEEVKWRGGWIREVRSHLGTNAKALLFKIPRHARHFEEFAASLAARDGTQVVIPVARWDHFFELTPQERSMLEAKGATVVEQPITGEGERDPSRYHNYAVLYPEQAEAAVQKALDDMAKQNPDSRAAREHRARSRHAELRRRHRSHRGAGVQIARDEAATDDTRDHQSVS